jgi:hypothetical protein
VAEEGGAAVMRLAGDIDNDAVIAFEQSGVSDGRAIRVVDVSEVTFLSSSGVAVLIRPRPPGIREACPCCAGSRTRPGGSSSRPLRTGGGNATGPSAER